MTKRAQKIMDTFYQKYPDLEKHYFDKECIISVICEIREMLSVGIVDLSDQMQLMYNLGYDNCLKDLDLIVEELENL